MRTVDIKNIDINVWTRKIESPQTNLPHSLTHPEITRQRTFEFTRIKYDQIKDEISSKEYVDCNTTIRRNVISVDDI